MGLLDLMGSAKNMQSTIAGSGSMKKAAQSKNNANKALASSILGASENNDAAAQAKKRRAEQDAEAATIEYERGQAEYALPRGGSALSNRQILEWALSCLGKPYAAGCAGPTHFDERGLIGYVASGSCSSYRNRDVLSVNCLSAQQSGCVGDVLVTDNSLGVYAGNGRWITASERAGKVVLERVPRSSKMIFCSGCYPEDHDPEVWGSGIPQPLSEYNYPSTY